MVSSHIRYVRPDLAVCVLPCWLAPEQHDTLMHALQTELEWNQGAVSMFGKSIDEPRLTAWCGDTPYVYSRRRLEPKAWHPSLLNLRSRLERLMTELGLVTPFGLNHCLLNLYRSGQDSMGWHRDNEAELGIDPMIVSLSLGQARRFRLRPRKGIVTSPLTFELGKGDLLVMYGRTQTGWEHALMKTKQSMEPRINITFRSVAG